MRTESPIARVRGLGSARAGAHHWWLERLTSVATFILLVWLLVALLRLPDLGHDAIVEWLASPLVAVPMLLLIVATFWHLKLGLQVVIEDYVHEEGMKLFSITLLNFFTIALGATAFFSVLKIAFGGAPD
ncbi:MAG TPA: succinate dehydrogenase, hydrophobic membrane anchor protein [Allosphingosinicella sp.]|jgi:succinate dehydrogenase / fumarate reductase membrane anchor subunit